jgi:hypothetical protein
VLAACRPSPCVGGHAAGSRNGIPGGWSTCSHWAGSVLESAAGHHVAGVAAGMFGARLPAAGRRTADEMAVRVERRPIGLDRRSLAAAFPGATGSVAVFRHGLVETERSWFRGAAPAGDFGARMAADPGTSPVHVRYNSGRHVSENGDDLVTLLSRLVAAWPVAVTDIVLVGHSIGGLVARDWLRADDVPATATAIA